MIIKIEKSEVVFALDDVVSLQVETAEWETEEYRKRLVRWNPEKRPNPPRVEYFNAIVAYQITLRNGHKIDVSFENGEGVEAIQAIAKATVATIRNKLVGREARTFQIDQ